MIRLLFILTCCIPIAVAAQFTDICVDTNRINQYYQCNNPEFVPICGCNAVTYRNNCEMNNVAGVLNNQFTYNGVCQNEFFFFFISPNPVRNNLKFEIQLADQQTGNGTLQVFNSFGNTVYTELLNSVTSFPLQKSYNFTELEPGVYIMVVQINGVYRIRKFLKHNF